jgi:hypothetical protein
MGSHVLPSLPGLPRQPEQLVVESQVVILGVAHSHHGRRHLRQPQPGAQRSAQGKQLC